MLDRLSEAVLQALGPEGERHGARRPVEPFPPRADLPGERCLEAGGLSRCRRIRSAARRTRRLKGAVAFPTEAQAELVRQLVGGLVGGGFDEARQPDSERERAFGRIADRAGADRLDGEHPRATGWAGLTGRCEGSPSWLPSYRVFQPLLAQHLGEGLGVRGADHTQDEAARDLFLGEARRLRLGLGVAISDQVAQQIIDSRPGIRLELALVEPQHEHLGVPARRRRGPEPVCFEPLVGHGNAISDRRLELIFRAPAGLDQADVIARLRYVSHLSQTGKHRVPNAPALLRLLGVPFSRHQDRQDHDAVRGAARNDLVRTPSDLVGELPDLVTRTFGEPVETPPGSIGRSRFVARRFGGGDRARLPQMLRARKVLDLPAQRAERVLPEAGVEVLEGVSVGDRCERRGRPPALVGEVQQVIASEAQDQDDRDRNEGVIALFAVHVRLQGTGGRARLAASDSFRPVHTRRAGPLRRLRKI